MYTLEIERQTKTIAKCCASKRVDGVPTVIYIVDISNFDGKVTAYFFDKQGNYLFEYECCSTTIDNSIPEVTKWLNDTFIPALGILSDIKRNAKLN